MRIFKYCKQAHMDSFFADGSLRIGTLYDYRSEENHGHAVGDPKEGALVFSGTEMALTKEKLVEMPLLKGVIDLADGAVAGVTFSNCNVDRGNLYIFSASQEYSIAAHRKWADDPSAQYNACYKIESASLFFKAISRAIADRASFIGFGPVQYYDSEKGLDIHSPLGQLHPGQLKGGKSYSRQIEIRAYWRPLRTPAEPFFPNVPEAIRYCTRMATVK